jgi:FlaA1/EpsC-like NDP-sugar epimerase
MKALAQKLLQMDRPHKRMLVLCGDAILCVMAIFFAFALRVGALYFGLHPFLVFAAVCLPLFPVIFIGTGVYATIFRFAGIGTIRDLLVATVIYAIPLVAVFMFYGMPGVPRTVALLQPIIFFGLTSGSRIVGRMLLAEVTSRNRGGDVRRTLIYGAGSAGMQLALSLRHEHSIAVVGFVDDDHRLDQQRLEGLRVHHSDRLPTVIRQRQVDAVLLALPNITRRRRREIIEFLRTLQVSVKTLPQMQELVDGRVSISDLRELQIEDLLGRDPVTPNHLLLSRTISGKTVMVTGAGGSIGSELARQIVKLGPTKLVLVEMTEHALYQIEAELREAEVDEGVRAPEIVPELFTLIDAEATRRVITKYRPHTIFHAAAYKHVPLVEANVISGLRNNVLGTLNAARAAEEAGTQRFMLISTDKAVRPTNVMGASKRVCELILQSLAGQGSNTKFAMVRFGNVLGSSGSVVPLFQRQIREGGPITLTHRDVTRYFMTIPEAGQLVIQAGAMAEGGEVYLLDMGSSVRIYDLARTMVELSGLSVRDEHDPDGEIEIVEVGLRPGEKLYEELLIGADSQPTNNPRINRAVEYALTRVELDPLLDKLMGALETGNGTAALKVLQQLVPEYQPENGTELSGRLADEQQA